MHVPNYNAIAAPPCVRCLPKFEDLSVVCVPPGTGRGKQCVTCVKSGRRCIPFEHTDLAALINLRVLVASLEACNFPSSPHQGLLRDVISEMTKTQAQREAATRLKNVQKRRAAKEAREALGERRIGDLKNGVTLEEKEAKKDIDEDEYAEVAVLIKDIPLSSPVKETKGYIQKCSN